MDSKEALKGKITMQLAKWKTSIDNLKPKIEAAEAAAKTKLDAELETLHDKRVLAEKLLEDISTVSHERWEQVKAGVDEGWRELTQATKNGVAKLCEAMTKPRDDEEIRQIAYQLWLDEGCPHGQHLDHWRRAEEIWQARLRKTSAAPRPKKIAKKTTGAKRERPTIGK